MPRMDNTRREPNQGRIQVMQPEVQGQAIFSAPTPAPLDISMQGTVQAGPQGEGPSFMETLFKTLGPETNYLTNAVRAYSNSKKEVDRKKNVDVQEEISNIMKQQSAGELTIAEALSEVKGLEKKYGIEKYTTTYANYISQRDKIATDNNIDIVNDEFLKYQSEIAQLIDPEDKINYINEILPKVHPIIEDKLMQLRIEATSTLAQETYKLTKDETIFQLRKTLEDIVNDPNSGFVLPQETDFIESYAQALAIVGDADLIVSHIDPKTGMVDMSSLLQTIADTNKDLPESQQIPVNAPDEDEYLEHLGTAQVVWNNLSRINEGVKARTRKPTNALPNQKDIMGMYEAGGASWNNLINSIFNTAKNEGRTFKDVLIVASKMIYLDSTRDSVSGYPTEQVRNELSIKDPTIEKIAEQDSLYGTLMREAIDRDKSTTVLGLKIEDRTNAENVLDVYKQTQQKLNNLEIKRFEKDKLDFSGINNDNIFEKLELKGIGEYSQYGFTMSYDKGEDIVGDVLEDIVLIMSNPAYEDSNALIKSNNKLMKYLEEKNFDVSIIKKFSNLDLLKHMIAKAGDDPRYSMKLKDVGNFSPTTRDVITNVKNFTDKEVAKAKQEVADVTYDRILPTLIRLGVNENELTTILDDGNMVINERFAQFLRGEGSYITDDGNEIDILDFYKEGDEDLEILDILFATTGDYPINGGVIDVGEETKKNVSKELETETIMSTDPKDSTPFHPTDIPYIEDMSKATIQDNASNIYQVEGDWYAKEGEPLRFNPKGNNSDQRHRMLIEDGYGIIDSIATGTYYNVASGFEAGRSIAMHKINNPNGGVRSNDDLDNALKNSFEDVQGSMQSGEWTAKSVNAFGFLAHYYKGLNTQIQGRSFAITDSDILGLFINRSGDQPSVESVAAREEAEAMLNFAKHASEMDLRKLSQEFLKKPEQFNIYLNGLDKDRQIKLAYANEMLAQENFYQERRQPKNAETLSYDILNLNTDTVISDESTLVNTFATLLKSKALLNTYGYISPEDFNDLQNVLAEWRDEARQVGWWKEAATNPSERLLNKIVKEKGKSLSEDHLIYSLIDIKDANMFVDLVSSDYQGGKFGGPTIPNNYGPTEGPEGKYYNGEFTIDQQNKLFKQKFSGPRGNWNEDNVMIQAVIDMRIRLETLIDKNPTLKHALTMLNGKTSSLNNNKPFSGIQILDGIMGANDPNLYFISNPMIGSPIKFSTDRTNWHSIGGVHPPDQVWDYFNNIGNGITVARITNQLGQQQMKEASKKRREFDMSEYSPDNAYIPYDDDKIKHPHMQAVLRNYTETNIMSKDFIYNLTNKKYTNAESLATAAFSLLQANTPNKDMTNEMLNPIKEYASAWFNKQDKGNKTLNSFLLNLMESDIESKDFIRERLDYKGLKDITKLLNMNRIYYGNSKGNKSKARWYYTKEGEGRSYVPNLDPSKLKHTDFTREEDGAHGYYRLQINVREISNAKFINNRTWNVGIPFELFNR